MSKVRPPYPADFRQQMVELVRAGRSPAQLSREEELVRLRRQLRQVQMERDILAKATAWFAGRSDTTSTKSSDS